MAVRLLVLPGVFRPISDSHLLAEAVSEHVRPGSSMLDVCTGSGLLAVTAPARAAVATAVDVSRRAVTCARLNGALNGVRVRGRRGSLLEPVAGERFDLIASNPPYVPSAEEELPDRGPRRAWDAGLDGRVLLDRLIAEAPDHLHPGGSLLLTQSTIIGEAETLRRLAEAGLEADVLTRREGPLGPLMRSRRDHLVAAGLLAPDQDTEEVLIIRGRRPAAGARRVAARSSAAAHST